MCFALRATSGLPLDRSKGKPLTRAEYALAHILPLSKLLRSIDGRKKKKLYQSHRAIE